MTRFQRNIITRAAWLVLMFILASTILTLAFAALAQPAAQCETDADCAALCTPDTDCDGGPEA